MQWLGNGPGRVWKNRLAGMEYGVWNKQRKTEHKLSLSGHHWDTNWFAGYYANVNWAKWHTDEGPITFFISNPNVYVGVLTPRTPPNPKNTKVAHPDGDLSFLHGIPPKGSKWQPVERHGPSAQSNIYREKRLTNTLWFYFDKDL